MDGEEPHRARLRGWPLPALVSVGLHALALGCWALATSSITVREGSRPPTIDCCRLEEAAPENADPIQPSAPSPHPVQLPPGSMASKVPARHPAESGSFAATLQQATFLTESTHEGAAQSFVPRTSPRAAFYKVETTAQRILYVIDSSASMGKNGLLAAASAELCRSLGELPPSSRCQVIVFNSRARLLLPHHPAWLTPQRQVIDEIHAALDTLPAEGRTDYRAALAMALAFAPETIYLLTDGSELSASDLAEVTRMNRGRTSVHVINLRNNDGACLRELALRNNGEYRRVPPQ